jgi:6-phosphogluconolactonase (cycloisomerase 2 family)
MRYLLSVPLAGLMMFSGCGQFFPPITSTSGGGGGSNTGDYLYVANSSTSLNTVAGFSVGTTLKTTASSPYDIGATPTAIAITPNNEFLYVASLTDGAIFGYAINSNGSLTALNSGSPLVTGVAPEALKVDTTGNCLQHRQQHGDTDRLQQRSCGTHRRSARQDCLQFGRQSGLRRSGNGWGECAYLRFLHRNNQR